MSRFFGTKILTLVIPFGTQCQSMPSFISDGPFCIALNVTYFCLDRVFHLEWTRLTNVCMHCMASSGVELYSLCPRFSSNLIMNTVWHFLEANHDNKAICLCRPTATEPRFFCFTHFGALPLALDFDSLWDLLRWHSQSVVSLSEGLGTQITID